MFLLSKAIKSLINILPEFSVSIPSGHMKGTKWIAKSANPGQAIGRYEPEQEKQFLDLLDDVNVLWDVGAHVGWYSLLAAKKLKTESLIYSFEPNPNNLHFLKLHKQINHCPNIKIIEKALSDSEGEAYFSDEAQQSALNEKGEFKVSVTTADKIAAEYDEAPDLIKIDVEGAEMDFLKGAEKLVASVRPKILLSAHGYKKNDECLKWLQDKDYITQHLVANTEQGDYVIFAAPKH